MKKCEYCGKELLSSSEENKELVVFCKPLCFVNYMVDNDWVKARK